MLRKILFLILIVLTMYPSYGQEEAEDVTVNGQFWLDFNGKYNIDETTAVSGFLGYRSISPHVYDKFLLYATYDVLHTKPPDFLKLKKPLINSFHFGGGLYFTDNVIADNNFEFRLTQAMTFFLPSIKQVPLKNRLQVEERLQKTLGESAWSASLRFRYRIATVIEWEKHLFAFNKGMYIPLSVEFFFSLQEADLFNDVIRISPGIGYKFSDEWKAEFYISSRNRVYCKKE